MILLDLIYGDIVEISYPSGPCPRCKGKIRLNPDGHYMCTGKIIHYYQFHSRTNTIRVSNRYLCELDTRYIG